MKHLIVDELQRAWVLDLTNDSLKELLNEYGRQHGRPSRAVQEAFSRHKQVDVLRLLVYRGVHGERINLAARALALGPLPPSHRRVPARAGLSTQDQAAMQAAFDKAQSRRDAETSAALVAEADNFRERGYVE